MDFNGERKGIATDFVAEKKWKLAMAMVKIKLAMERERRKKAETSQLMPDKRSSKSGHSRSREMAKKLLQKFGI